MMDADKSKVNFQGKDGSAIAVLDLETNTITLNGRVVLTQPQPNLNVAPKKVILDDDGVPMPNHSLLADRRSKPPIKPPPLRVVKEPSSDQGLAVQVIAGVLLAGVVGLMMYFIK